MVLLSGKRKKILTQGSCEDESMRVTFIKIGNSLFYGVSCDQTATNAHGLQMSQSKLSEHISGYIGRL